MAVISIIGILLGLALLIFFAFKGKSMIWVAPLCAALVAVFTFGQINPLSAWTDNYMTGFAEFVQQWLPVFLLSAVFGKVMEYSGGAYSISNYIAKKIGSKHAISIVIISAFILTYGGINCWVVIFAIYPIADQLFKEADIPRRLMPATISAGTFTIAMTTLIGTPQIQNLLPMDYFGTTATAAPQISLICSCFELGTGWTWLLHRSKRLKRLGEHYTPKKGAAAELNFDINDLPNPFLCLLPFAVLLITLNILDWNINLCILLALVTAFIIFHKKLPNIVKAFDTGCKEAIQTIANTSAVVGFGSLIKATVGFQSLTTSVLAIGCEPLIFMVIVINLLAALSGSASGGLRIALDALGDVFLKNGLAAGYSPEILHRIASMSCGCLNSMPFDGGVVTMLSYCGVTHKEGYFDIVGTNLIGPLCGLTVGVTICLLGNYVF